MVRHCVLLPYSKEVIDFLENFAQEHGTSVREQRLWSPMPTHNLFDKDFGHGHSLGIGDGIDLRPLCQVVDEDYQVLVAHCHLQEVTHEVHSDSLKQSCA